MLPAVLMLLDWSASELEIVVYVPVVHYHTIEGPSRQIHTLEGPSKQIHTLEGPSKQVHVIRGGD